eukprot:12880303-Prorocentrum_lima.AAC.1
MCRRQWAVVLASFVWGVFSSPPDQAPRPAAAAAAAAATAAAEFKCGGGERSEGKGPCPLSHTTGSECSDGVD